MNLFIDTNVLLNFFHFSKDSLEELEKVFVLQTYGKISLWLTDQVKLEFSRNRETKIADALKKFLDEKPNSGIPHVARGYPESDQLMEALKQVNSSRDQLMVKVRNDISEKSLYADTLIKEIFTKSTRIKFTEDQFNSAKRRTDLRSPPGKNNSLGDAINWEALLTAIPEGQDIFIVSEDGDFSSPLDSERLSDFLTEEWATKKKSKAVLYKRLSQFLSLMFPDAKVAAELEKDILIAELATSCSFATTHQTVAALNKFASFSPKQASEIADAYIINSQVGWIASDEDVNAFGKKVQEAHSATLDPEQQKAFLGLLAK
jgi:hypothetical protein